MIITVHVDDLIIAVKTEQHVQKIKRMIADKFAVKDLGELEYVLVINVD